MDIRSPWRKNVFNITYATKAGYLMADDGGRDDWWLANTRKRSRSSLLFPSLRRTGRLHPPHKAKHHFVSCLKHHAAKSGRADFEIRHFDSCRTSELDLPVQVRGNRNGHGDIVGFTRQPKLSNGFKNKWPAPFVRLFQRERIERNMCSPSARRLLNLPHAAQTATIVMP